LPAHGAFVNALHVVADHAGHRRVELAMRCVRQVANEGLVDTHRRRDLRHPIELAGVDRAVHQRHHGATAQRLLGKRAAWHAFGERVRCDRGREHVEFGFKEQPRCCGDGDTVGFSDRVRAMRQSDVVHRAQDGNCLCRCGIDAHGCPPVSRHYA
jgi:hypothetical protein